jgi:hypothetical protein
MLTHDEDKRMAALLKNKYAIISLPDIDLENEARDVGAILRLGRRDSTLLFSYISERMPLSC